MLQLKFSEESPRHPQLTCWKSSRLFPRSQSRRKMEYCCAMFRRECAFFANHPRWIWKGISSLRQSFTTVIQMRGISGSHWEVLSCGVIIWRKQLHVHGVARTASSPKALKEAERLKENTAETRKLCQFAEAILSAELPGSDEPEKCTQCDVELVAEETVFACARFYGVQGPFMYHCPACNNQFTATLLNQIKLKRDKKEMQISIRTAREGGLDIEEFNVDQYIRATLLVGGRLHI